MTQGRSFIALALLLSLVTYTLVGCARPANAGRSNNDTALQLGNGREVKVLGLMMLRVANNPSERILLLNYQTNINLNDNDVPALHKEALMVWDKFRPEVERSGYTEAALKANAPPTGFLVHFNKQYGFFFVKRSGHWVEIPPKKPNPGAG